MTLHKRDRPTNPYRRHGYALARYLAGPQKVSLPFMTLSQDAIVRLETERSSPAGHPERPGAEWGFISTCRGFARWITVTGYREAYFNRRKHRPGPDDFHGLC